MDDFNQTIQLLESGRIDATLNDEVVFYDYMNQHPDAVLKIAAENDEPTHVAFPLRRETATESLLAAMNEAIAELREGRHAGRALTGVFRHRHHRGVTVDRSVCDMRRGHGRICPRPLFALDGFCGVAHRPPLFVVMAVFPSRMLTVMAGGLS